MKTLRDREAQTKEEKTSHMTLFCALMMVKKGKATLEQAIRVVPLTGNARVLAKQLENVGSQSLQLKINRQSSRGEDPVASLIETFLRKYRQGRYRQQRTPEKLAKTISA